MSYLQNYGQSSEVKHLVSFKGDSTTCYIGVLEVAVVKSLKAKLESIRNENVDFYKALSLDKFD